MIMSWVWNNFHASILDRVEPHDTFLIDFPLCVTFPVVLPSIMQRAKWYAREKEGMVETYI